MLRVGSIALVVAFAATSVALAGRGDPKTRFTPADQARARAMVLRRSDFDAAFVARRSSQNGGDFHCSALDQSDLTLTGRATSPSFAAGTAFVVSTASVYASRSDSNASWARGTSKAGEECLRRGLGGELQGTVELVSFRRMPFPKRGTRSVAYRVLATVQTARVYIDLSSYRSRAPRPVWSTSPRSRRPPQASCGASLRSSRSGRRRRWAGRDHRVGAVLSAAKTASMPDQMAHGDLAGTAVVGIENRC